MATDGVCCGAPADWARNVFAAIVSRAARDTKSASARQLGS